MLGEEQIVDVDLDKDFVGLPIRNYSWDPAREILKPGLVSQVENDYQKCHAPANKCEESGLSSYYSSVSVLKGEQSDLSVDIRSILNDFPLTAEGLILFTADLNI